MCKSNNFLILGNAFFTSLFSISLVLYTLFADEIYIRLILIIFTSFLLFQLLVLFFKNRMYSIYFFYILLSFFFIFNRIFFYFFDSNKYNWLKITFPYEHIFSPEIGVRFIVISYVSFFTISLIYFFLKMPKKDVIYAIKFRVNYDFYYYRIGMGLLLVSFIPLLYKYYLQLKFIKQFPSYAVAIFAYNGPGPTFPFWTNGAGTIFVVGFLLVLYSAEDLKQVKLALFFFLIQQIGSALKGSRAMLFCFIITVPLFLKKQYNVNIKTSLFIIVGIFSILFAVFIQNFRMNGDKNFFTDDFFLSFLHSQTTTIGGPFIYLDNEGDIPYHNYPYIFSPIVNMINGSNSLPNASLEKLQKINTLSLTTTYLVNPTLYFSGGGVGQNFLIETYDCGKYLGVILWSAILAIIMLRIDTIKYRKGIDVCLSFYMYEYILFLPRNTFFGFLQEMKYILFLVILMFFLRFFLSTLKHRKKIIK